MPRKWKVLLVLGIVGNVLIYVIAFTMIGQIRDKNGKTDYALTTVTEQQLFRTFDAVTVIGTAKDISDDGAQTSLQYMLMSGTQTVHFVRPTSNELVLTVSNEIARGNCRIVILIDGVYYCDIPLNTVETVTLSDIEGKDVYVRLGGESLMIKMTVTHEEN